MHRIKSVLLGMALSVVAVNAWGQAANSPYTARGLGDVYSMGLAHNQGMGGLGISNGSFWYLNNMNPALLSYNSLTVFSAGFIGEYRNIDNGTATESNGGGNLAYLATAFPVKPGRWTTAVGLMPYSNVGYNFSYIDKVEGSDTDVQITEEGSGGLSQLYWSNGVALNKKFAVGLKAAYLFSNIATEYSNQLVGLPGSAQFSPTVSENISVSDFMLSGGLSFNQDSIFNNRIQLKAGFTYDFQANVKAKRFLTTEQRLSGNPVATVNSDTSRGNFVIPQAFGFGLSLNNRQKWMMGIDVRMQQWTDFEDFSGNDDDLDNSMSITLGGEFTPNATSVTSYLKRMTYRVGLSYDETPYVINNKQVKDFGINFGWSLPVGRFSSLDMAFKYGRRGDIQDNLIKEDYFKIYLGVNFNDQWFVRRKFD